MSHSLAQSKKIYIGYRFCIHVANSSMHALKVQQLPCAPLKRPLMDNI